MRTTRRSASGKALAPSAAIGAELVAHVKGLESDPGAVGWFETAKYPTGVPVAYVASIQEFGWGPIPPRPFMRPAIQTKSPEWAELFGKIAKAVAAGKLSSNAAMTQICSKAAGDVRFTISRLTAPPLKPATVKARMNKYRDRKTRGALDKPLIENGYLMDTVTFRVGPIS